MGATAGSVVTGLNPTTFNPSNPLILFIIQALIIIGFCHVLHLGLRKLKQPRVISEVIAGIILGPSALGRIPGFASTIFNPLSLPYLNLVSNIGLVLFLFLVGLELDPVLVLKRARFALGISFAGMALPFGVGAAVSYALYEELGSDTSVGFGQFLLFCGVAMSITAFPVLARILAEQKLLTTKVGFLTICAGAVGDIVAWVLLALVVSIINSESKITPLYVVLLSIAWVLVLVYLVRPLMIFMIRFTKSEDEPSQTMMAFTIAVVLISAFMTDIIGVHAIFGSFLVGLIIPTETGFADGVTKRIEDLVTVIFLPIYFALSGLKTQIGLLDNARIWGMVILVTFVACFGKIVGCTGAARIQGMEWRESLAIGVLMNCKGLIELIVLNIGYDAGVINGKVFVIMVMMCLITTCMTTPGVTWVYPVHYQRAVALRTLAKEKAKKDDLEQPDHIVAVDRSKQGILLCLDKIQNVPAMMTFLDMLHYAVPRSGDRADSGSTLKVHADHIHPPNSVSFTPDAPQTGPLLFALRLLHLSDRSSSVLMAATDQAEVLRRDTLMVVFQAFAKLNEILVTPRMTLSTDHDDFAQSIYDEAAETGSGVIIFPWNTTSVPDLPSSNADDSHNAILPKPVVASNTQVISRLLHTTSNTGVTTAIFVDRELGSAGSFANIMVPLFGSYDDEEALKLASMLSHNKQCNVIIVRIESELKSKAAAAELHLDIDSHSINSELEEESEARRDVPEDNETVIQYYFAHRAYPHGNKRQSKKLNTGLLNIGVEAGENIFIHQVATVQDAVTLAKTSLGSRDLMIVGRGSTRTVGRSNFVQTATGLNSMATGIHTTGASPTQPVDTPSGEYNAGLRPRNTLRTHPSTRDVHHQMQTVSNVLGAAAQLLLSSDVSCCLLVVQSGRRAIRPILSRVASSIFSGSLRIQHGRDTSTTSANPQGRPIAFSREHSFSVQHPAPLEIVGEKAAPSGADEKRG